MKKGKSILSVLSVFILLFSVAACGKNESRGEYVFETSAETEVTASEELSGNEAFVSDVSVPEITAEADTGTESTSATEKQSKKADNTGTVVSETKKEKTTVVKTRVRTEYTTVNNTVARKEKTTRQPTTSVTVKVTQQAATKVRAAVPPANVIVSPVTEVRTNFPSTAAVTTGTKSASTEVLTTTAEAKQETVKVVVSCRNAVKYGKTDVPQNGTMLSTQVAVSQGDTAMDVLKKALKESGIEISESRGYIKGIGGLNEKDCGSSSGWMYMVNSETPMTSSDKYEVSPNDTVTFYYVTNYGDNA